MKARQSNIELLRIVLMTMVVLSHFIIHGYPASAFVVESNVSYSNVGKILLYALCSGAVDCFMFISGYFGIQLNKKRLSAYMFQVVFYALITYFLYHFWILQHGLADLFSWKTFCSLCNLEGKWWFVFAYLGVMLLAPFVNAGFDILSKKEQIVLIGTRFLLYCSGLRYITHAYIESLPIMLLMYMLGRFLRKHPIEWLSKYSGCIYVLSLSCLLLWQSYFIWTDSNDRTIMLHLVSCANPICMLIGITLFYTFQKWHLSQSKWVNFIASGAFAAYLMNAVAGLICILHAQMGDRVGNVDINEASNSQFIVDTNTFHLEAPEFPEDEQYSFVWKDIEKTSGAVLNYPF